MIKPRKKGSKVQLGNIQATKHVADIIRTCLGPRSMYKMLMDPQVGKTFHLNISLIHFTLKNDFQTYSTEKGASLGQLKIHKNFFVTP